MPTVQRAKPLIKTSRIVLDDWAMTTVHQMRFNRKSVQPQLVVFSEEQSLLEYCKENQISYAISGGFFSRKAKRSLGEMWLNGKKQKTETFIEQFAKKRGSIDLTKLQLGPRDSFPKAPSGDFLQAGPLLVQKGKVIIKEGLDPDGFSAGAEQFDDDISVGRFPRLAIGVNDKYIFCVACDGRSKGEAGLTLKELAEYMKKIGATDALNLDGGSSASLIADSKLINSPRGGEDNNFELFERGRPIHSAILFK